MTYAELIAHIFARGRFGMKPGLARISTLLENLHNPHKELTAVHVAGTNGKGSTSAFLAAILSASGLRVGLFTSPHLVSFTERIRIGGVEVQEEQVIALGERVLAAAPDDATFFEIVTAMALLHFAEERVDLVILEAGMGGQFDATAIVQGVMTLFTPIALDHCTYLGPDVTAIALDKSGLVRPGRPVVSAPQSAAALAVLTQRCRDLQAPLLVSGREFTATWEGMGLAYRGLSTVMSDLHPGIGGRYQDVNAGVALAAAELIGAERCTITADTMRQGVEDARWPGRMERLGSAPALFLDGAHNPAATAALAGSLEHVPHRRLILVLGLMSDKDVRGTIAPLLPLADRVIAVSPSLERALPAPELARLCEGMGCADAVAAESVADGLRMAVAAATPDDLVLVTGSLFTVGEVRALVQKRQFQGIRG